MLVVCLRNHIPITSEFFKPPFLRLMHFLLHYSMSEYNKQAKGICLSKKLAGTIICFQCQQKHLPDPI